MELKDYQVAALEAFVRWRDALAEARTEADETIAKLKSVDLAVPDDYRNYPKVDSLVTRGFRVGTGE